MTDATPTPDRPADQLRAAAELLREAAGHATPGPWRTHDTHLGGVGGHTATVLTDRPNLNDTELIAWLPTMSHEPWDETRNAWRNAGWMALMDPGVGLALAAWLEWQGRAIADGRIAVPDAALAVARQLLGLHETCMTPQATRMSDTAPAVWVDGDPLMEAVASAVWEQCRTENSIVVDDPRNIAAVAATVARQLLGTTSETTAAEEREPIQLRWGLDDVMYGDDDTTTVLLSGPDREPYWVELDPERTAVLRDALAGPEAAAAPPAPADRAAVLAEAAEVAGQMGGRFGTDDHGDVDAGWNDACEAIATDLRRLAGEAAAGAHQTEARTRIADALAAADGWKWSPGFKNSSPTYEGYLRQADVALAALATPAAPRQHSFCTHGEGRADGSGCFLPPGHDGDHDVATGIPAAPAAPEETP